MGNLESVLASSTVAVSWAAIVASACMWYGSASNPTECYGPTRYHWDLGLYLQGIETRVQAVQALGSVSSQQLAWSTFPLWLPASGDNLKSGKKEELRH